MNENIKNYKAIEPNKKPTFEQKITKMRSMVLDSEKCKEIAQKLSAYIADNN